MKNGEWKMENEEIKKEDGAMSDRVFGFAMALLSLLAFCCIETWRSRRALDRIADNLQGLAVIKIGPLDQEPSYRVPEPFHYVPPPAIEHRTYRVEVLDGTNVIWREGMEALR
ncbi:MAG: hypothetical protein IJQ73_07830 [Kiritimatiellae bacterium]|nr:hypothetical protein [Kiritimatiellia bacterium]